MSSDVQGQELTVTGVDEVVEAPFSIDVQAVSRAGWASAPAPVVTRAKVVPMLPSMERIVLEVDQWSAWCSWAALHPSGGLYGIDPLRRVNDHVEGRNAILGGTVEAVERAIVNRKEAVAKARYEMAKIGMPQSALPGDGIVLRETVNTQTGTRIIHEMDLHAVSVDAEGAPGTWVRVVPSCPVCHGDPDYTVSIGMGAAGPCQVCLGPQAEGDPCPMCEGRRQIVERDRPYPCPRCAVMGAT